LPVVLRSDGNAETLGRPGTLLGVFDEVTTHPAETTLRTGDVVFLYTDGITDLPPPHDVLPGELVKIFRDAVRAGSAEQIADAVLEALSGRFPIEQRQDDIALIILRVD
jgi:sigma-B regulation protein RsbU (phosphoserine phosphatase)